MEVARRFGINLKHERKRSGLSQEAVAIRAELHRTEVGMLERGIRLPRIDTLIKLAGSVEADPAELLEGIEWRPAIPRTGRFGVRDSVDTDREGEA